MCKHPLNLEDMRAYVKNDKKGSQKRNFIRNDIYMFDHGAVDLRNLQSHSANARRIVC